MSDVVGKVGKEDARSRCGFVAVVGVPNAGKSTLINTLVGTKVSIVSRKVQTTRTRVLGITLHENAQIAFIDTPGIFHPKKTLDRAMVRAAWDSVPDADVVLHIVDAAERNTREKNRIIMEKLPEHMPCVLVLNKVDRVNKPDLLALAADLNATGNYEATFMVSALENKGVGDLLSYLAGTVPEGPWHFEEDQITDMPMRMMAAEITREKIFDRLHQELPYSIMVHTESWEESEGRIEIGQVIFVARDSQKGIVLGKGGRTIKEIGQAARHEMEDLFSARVHLKTFVKVQENWTEKAENYALMGLDSSE